MKTIRSKHVVVGADFAGFPLKEAVKAHLEERGWHVTDLTPDIDTAPMYHRVGFALGAKIAEGEFERALAFCGTGMGIHIAASKVPHVHAAVAESLPAARRAAAANNANLLAMGAFWTAPPAAMAMADAFLESTLGSGYEDWEGFHEYHRIGFDECEHFDYEAYKANGFEVPNPQSAVLAPQPVGLAY
ncbi:RpiB/LacA/LacB family sugar-phosphate isomerase [Schaalia sp. 19OD2882]|uniref:RpiB/LacA/LacB family sugar-phosphate isomerase n=1 Tax=Schaalia sp. 19OD2882 TaxID=2794089 RepID=UPI001C1EFE1C|nr:RpiB/LacA/LacB family sugar-phosphate isomerase [Schaalia sp. 19OD2882]QWW19648.1 RpiB/LacA/LacB family sugar-phosphate isomerase [Schaalia sp. 19OD2882]